MPRTCLFKKKKKELLTNLNLFNTIFLYLSLHLKSERKEMEAELVSFFLASVEHCDHRQSVPGNVHVSMQPSAVSIDQRLTGSFDRAV